MSVASRTLCVACTLVTVVLASLAPAWAQPAEPRLAIAVGPEWMGEASMGGQDAVLTANGGATGFTLFRTESTLAGDLGPSASLGVRLFGGLWGEVSARYHSARFETRVSGDAEAAEVTATEGIQQLQVEAGALWLPDRMRLGRHVRLHAAAGGGWLRQLHASNTLGQNGRSYYTGGGIVIDFPRRPGGTFKQAGLRLEARAVYLQDGVAFDDRVHVAPAIWTALFLRF